MSSNSRHDFDLDLPCSKINRSSPKIEVEVLLQRRTAEHLWLQSCEDSPVIQMPKPGIKVLSTKDGVTTLEMSEHQAISYNLA